MPKVQITRELVQQMRNTYISEIVPGFKSVADLARSTGLSYSTTHRIISNQLYIDVEYFPEPLRPELPSSQLQKILAMRNKEMSFNEISKAIAQKSGHKFDPKTLQGKLQNYLDKGKA